MAGEEWRRSFRRNTINAEVHSCSKHLMRSFSVPWIHHPHKPASHLTHSASAFDSELEHAITMTLRFSNLLLGEDVTGGSKGISTALAISNAITNLSAAVFGAVWKLEPLPPQNKALWFKEMEWLLSVSDLVVEFVPTLQHSPNGTTYEVMATRQRTDLLINLPALKKLDAMLISILDEFEHNDFCYHDPNIILDDYRFTRPKLPKEGLSQDSRKTLQQCRDCANQIMKAASAIHANVLTEINIPISYLETLPENGKDCLSDTIYNYIADDQLEPDHILSCLNLSSENQVLDMVNKIERAINVWKQKQKHLETETGIRKLWSGKAKILAEGKKNQHLVERAEILLQYLKYNYPGLPQTVLDMNKIEHNKDIGHAILESYSRVMESMAFNLIARIDDVLSADDAAKGNTATGAVVTLPIHKKILPSPFSIHPSPYTSLLNTTSDSPHPVA